MYQRKSGIGVYVARNDTLLSFLQSKARYFDLPSHKDALLSHIFCGEIAVCKVPSFRNHVPMTQKKILLEEDFFLNNTIEIVREHKYTVCANMFVIYVRTNTFVSRGGDKLKGVLDNISYTVKDKIWIDCGASTGGFTDCLLQAGASHVYAIDVGYNQFDFVLKRNKNITLMERTNVLSLREDSFTYGKPHAAVVDVSFRSLLHFLSYILPLLRDMYIIALCKPQFELSFFKKKRIDSAITEIPFNGIIKNKKYLTDIVYAVLLELYKENVYVHTVIPSKLKGSSGNQEFFFEIHNSKKDIHDETIELYYKKMSMQAVEESS